MKKSKYNISLHNRFNDFNHDDEDNEGSKDAFLDKIFGEGGILRYFIFFM